MSLEIIDQNGRLLQLRIRGELRRADYERMTALARAAIAREGSIRVLAILDGFTGWERHPGWNDMSFLMGDGDHIEKMAIVGEENWRDDALAFTAAGLRPTAIEFFSSSSLADALEWLGR